MRREFFFFDLCMLWERKKISLFSQSVENKLCLCLVIEKVNEKREKKNWALNVMEKKGKPLFYSLFGWRGEGGGVDGSGVELTKNKLILY